MIQKRKQIAGLLLFVLFFGAFPGLVFAKEILIYSTSHNNEAEVSEKQGALIVEISSFSLIMQIFVNGQKQITPDIGKTKSRVVIPYNLKKGRNVFNVRVKTQEGEEQADFVLKLQEKKPKKALGLIGVIGGQQVANPTNVSNEDDYVGGKKGQITLVPSYTLWMSDEWGITLKGIGYREVYDKDELRPYEAQFTQVALSIKREAKNAVNFELGGGWNSVEGQYEMPYDAEYHKETNLFGFLKLRVPLGQNFSIDLEADGKNRNSQNVAENQNYEEDALIASFGMAINVKMAKILSISLKGGVQQTDAIGKFKDNTVSRGGIGLKLNLSFLIVSLDGNYIQTAYKEVDPLVNEKTLNKKSAYKIGLIVPIVSSFLIQINYKGEHQTSNISANEYDNKVAGLSMVFLY